MADVARHNRNHASSGDPSHAVDGHLKLAFDYFVHFFPWAERVVQTATVALRDFAAISSKYDFFEEGRQNFSAAFKEVEAHGCDPYQAMCFVWYAAEPGN